MNNSKHILLALIAFSPLVAVATETDHGFRELVVFGDSLSDSGNAFAATGETAQPPFKPIPSMAYGIGGHHFSNGRTWVEILAEKMNLVENAKPAFRDPAFGNFAFGGARARAYNETAPSFGLQVQSYLQLRGCPRDASLADTLFIVQFGGNDLRDALDAYLRFEDPTEIVAAAIDGIITNIGILAGCGGRNFLIANAPNLGAAPAVPDDFKGAVTWLSSEFNDNLQLAIGAYLSPTLNIGMVDFFGFVTGATMMPGAFGFSIASTPCLSFAVVENAICEDRDGHLFWDAIHPTKKAHALLGEIALGALPSGI